MQQEYYSLPISIENIMRKQEHAKCSLQQSVMQNLHLLLVTPYGGFPGDEYFGCSIWDNDFDNVTSTHKLKEMIRQSLLQAIKEYEKRLANVRAEVSLRQEELAGGPGRTIKKRIDISISGLLKLTNEPFSYKDSFFVGPLSY